MRDITAQECLEMLNAARQFHADYVAEAARGHELLMAHIHTLQQQTATLTAERDQLRTALVALRGEAVS